MRTKLAAMAAVLSVGVATAMCSSSEPEGSPTTQPPATQTPVQASSTAQPQIFQVAFSDKERIERPDVPAEDLKELSNGNNRFAFDLYSELAGSEDGNLFMSPYSISLALAMTYAGARSNTAEEMADALGFTLPPEELYAAFNALDQLLESRGAELEPDEKFTLEVANSIWGQDGFEFEQPFLDTLAENYGAGMRLVDYQTDAESARLAINQWVEENTNDRIKDLIPRGVLNDLTRLVLANAIFFKASWAHEFDENLTSRGDFHLIDGSQTSPEMMRQEVELPYLDGDNFKAAEIPYVGWDTSMVVLVPDRGGFERFESDLDKVQLAEILDELRIRNLNLEFPKFSFESKFSLPEQLKALGMEDAFTGGVADFSGMRPPPPNLYIKDVIHQSFVAVDEQGTEAAAATAAIIFAEQGPPPPVKFTIDRPFIFLIRDRATDTVLFMGRLMDPAA